MGIIKELDTTNTELEVVNEEKLSGLEIAEVVFVLGQAAIGGYHSGKFIYNKALKPFGGWVKKTWNNIFSKKEEVVEDQENEQYELK